MILNSQIWKQTIEAAQAKSTGNAALLRAIDRAVTEIERAVYWAFVAGVLRIQSTTSKELYVVDDAHTCEATQKGLVCKHKVARRLLQRYVERLGAAEATGETRTVRNWQADADHKVVETKRPSMLAASAIAPLQPPTLRGEMCNGIDV